MKVGWRRTLMIGVCAMAIGSGAAWSQAGKSRPPRGLAEAGQCFERQAALIPFSGVVLLDLNGSVFERAAGTADAEEQTKVTRSTQFRLASVQKVLTRIAIGRLVDRKQLEFDAPVGRYVKGLPAEFAAITVDQLLHHRSGIAGFTRMSRETMEALASARSARDLLPLIVAQPLEFRPGEKEAYSNGGYLLLGVVIEAVTGKEYGEYLEETIYRPLVMSSTGLTSGPATAVRKSKMMPGQPASTTPRPTRPPIEPRGTAAGDGVSTADDMMKLGKALLSDSLLKAPTKARLFPAKPGEPWRLGQSGGNIGTNTDFAVYPESGLVSIVLSNFDPPAGDAMGLVMRRAALGQGCIPLREEDAPGPRRGPPPERRSS
jgi:CubicO group peptidase (beta-lactamase class C family)